MSGEETTRLTLEQSSVVPLKAYIIEKALISSEYSSFLEDTAAGPHTSPYEGIPLPEDFKESLEATVRRVFELVTRDPNRAAKLAESVKIDFESLSLMNDTDAEYDSTIEEGGQDDNIIKVLDYETGQKETLKIVESVLPSIYTSDSNGRRKYRLIPSVFGGKEFRTELVDDRIKDSDVLNLYIAMGVAQIAIHDDSRLKLDSLRQGINLEAANGDDESRFVGRMNVAVLPDKNQAIIENYQLLWGVAIEAASPDVSVRDGLRDALRRRHDNEIEGYQDRTSVVEDLFITGLLNLGHTAADARAVVQALDFDPEFRQAYQDSLSELWLAAGEPLEGKLLHQLFENNYVKSIT